MLINIFSEKVNIQQFIFKKINNKLIVETEFKIY